MAKSLRDVSADELRAMRGESPMLTRTAVKARGWTDAVIEQLMPTPDKTHRNLAARKDSGSMTRLYLQQRVEAIERAAELLTANRKRKSPRP